MKILITGICGFVGSTLARILHDDPAGYDVIGMDNLIRPGSELNRGELRKLGIKVLHGDIRNQADIDALPAVDWVLDAAANPSVLAGMDGKSSTRQVVEHNLYGTINLLEYCKQHQSGFTLLSTSRVYSIPPLADLQMEVVDDAYRPVEGQNFPKGISARGVSEDFSTHTPVSLYGATKLASETMALEYGATFDFPVWINRCGVLAGAGQFGRADQGIFAFWINSWLRKKSLRYIGFDGQGHQVRDCLHPRDLLPALKAQFEEPMDTSKPRICNFAGGINNSMSLVQLSTWCTERFGANEVSHRAEERPFDIPWMVLDPNQANDVWNWQPRTQITSVLEEIADHAEANPDWLSISSE